VNVELYARVRARLPRYYARSITGYGLIGGGGGKPATYWQVQDSWNLWLPVTVLDRLDRSKGSRREKAEELAQQLNTENEMRLREQGVL